MFQQILAIIEAQLRSVFHFYSRGSKVGAIVASLLTGAWYVLVALGCVGAAFFCAQTSAGTLLRYGIASGCLFIIVYWQFMPLMLVSTGVGLDLKRLVVYPLSRLQLFGLELALRVTSGIEPLMLMTGATIGLWLNPALRWWAPFAFVPFIAFNLFMASGLRAVFGRLFSGRRTREISMLVLVMVATLPQILMTTGVLRRLGMNDQWANLAGSPWAVTAGWASGQLRATDVAASFAWIVVAAVFGWWQFVRSLRFDQAAAAASPTTTGVSWTDRLFRWPASVFRDPLAALVEKELRSLSRTPRFRVVFIMGFSFSLLIWLPMLAAAGRGLREGPPGNFLALMIGYAMLLLGESCFWNIFGFDRAAAQLYFLTPMPLAAVLRAKNVATAIVVVLEFLSITAVALILRLPLNFSRFAEGAAVGAVLTLMMLAAGNLGSIYAPRPADPADVWRKASAGKTQALVIFVSPLLAGPVALAYLARYAFDSDWAFWLTMAAVAGVAAVAYTFSVESAVGIAKSRREILTATLSRGSGPITS